MLFIFLGLSGLMGCTGEEEVKNDPSEPSSNEPAPNNDPMCEITAPEENSGFTVGESIAFSATATDEDINNALLIISWESNVDGVFDTTAANTAGENRAPHSPDSIA